MEGISLVFIRKLPLPIVITPTLTLPPQRGRGIRGFLDEN
jgi:hypothetical protein